MDVLYPELVTLSLKRNLSLGARMEVHTLTCTVYRNMIKKDGRSFSLTRLSGRDGMENKPQWAGFTELVRGKHVVAYSFSELENFWPSSRLRQFLSDNRKHLIELTRIGELFFPGRAFQSSEDMLGFIEEFVAADDNPSDDMTLRIFDDLSVYVSSLGLKSHQDIVTLLSIDSPAIAGWLDELRHVVSPRKTTAFRLPENIRKSDDTGCMYDLSDESIKEIFSADGPAGRSIPGYERRPEQVKYARRYLRTLLSDEYFLAEAGTGTGKSLAYLVPALLYAIDRRESVVVSTHTRSLQNQLFHKDLVQAQSMVGCGVSSLLLKGRANYLCLLRMHIARGMASRKFDSERLAELASVLIWKDMTESGDLSELGGLSTEVRREVCCDGAFCPGMQCAHFRDCFFFRARKAVGRSDLIVTNHALFFSDLLSEADILGKPGVVVFDEAHQVERVATDSLTGELSRSTMSGLFEPLESSDPGMPDMISSVTGMIVRQIENESEREEVKDANAACGALVSECQRSVHSLFAMIGKFVESRKMVPSGYSRRERLVPGHRFLDYIEVPLSDLHAKLQALEKKLSWLVKQVDQSLLEGDQVVAVESIQTVARSIAVYLFHINNVCEVDNARWVRWLEVSSSGWCAIKVAPVEIGEIMKQLVYDKYMRVLFTSATITVERDFEFIEERLGLDKVPVDCRTRAVFGSSFDFQSQVRFVCPAYLPSPRTDYYQGKLSAFLRQVFRNVDRATLVLFTSYQSLKSTIRDLGGQFPKVLAQEGSDSADKVLHDFRQLKPAILFGTESFWHGVDLPGDQLELLIITRLPFSVPGDPIDTARMELVEKRGANSFAAYSLPAAVLRFKQGFGRLIRTASDQGVIVVTDNRLVKTNFGQAFLNSVPTEIRIASCWEEVSNLLDFGQES